MKLCIIGIRGHTPSCVFPHLPDLPDVRVAGIAPGGPGDNFEKLRRWCDEHGHKPEIHEDYRRMLDTVKPDGVVVDGPFELHGEMTAEALERGCHVLSEKPVAASMEVLSRVRKARETSGRALLAMMESRYSAPFYRAWKVIREGGIGRVRMLNARKSYKLGQRGPHYGRRETYGGTIPWIGSHAVDWIIWCSGEKLESVHAVHSTRDNGGNGEMEMTAVCQFGMSNEVFATVSMDFLRPATALTHGDDQLRVAGTEGVVEVRHGAAYLINPVTTGEKELDTPCDRTLLGDFVNQIRGEGESLLPAEDTLICAEACLRARQSADEKRVVLFSER